MLLVMSLMLVGVSASLFLACRALCKTQDERDALKSENEALERKLAAESHRAEDLAWILRGIHQEQTR